MTGVDNVCGVLLAGGQSRRMGGKDKAFKMLAGQSLIARIIGIARPQVSALCLNTNRDRADFDAFGLPVVPDTVPGNAGPLAGILAGLAWARSDHPGCRWLASFACDAPFIPDDLVSRMVSAVTAEGATLACARSADRLHPVFGLWPLDLLDALDFAVREEGVRKVDIWTANYPLAVVEWPADPIDPFFNVNRPEDLAAAEKRVDADAR